MSHSAEIDRFLVYTCCFCCCCSLFHFSYFTYFQTIIYFLSFLKYSYPTWAGAFLLVSSLSQYLVYYFTHMTTWHDSIDLTLTSDVSVSSVLNGFG